MKLTRGLTAAIAVAASAVLLPAAASAAPARTAPARAHTAAAAAAPACSTSLETWFAPEGDGYAGGVVYVVEFSNIGTATCTVTGYPTVKLTENGTQVGLKARTSSATPATVTLHPGQTAHVVLTIGDAGASCRPLPTNGLSVQPPGNTQAPNFPLRGSACRHKSTTRVTPISPGVGIPHYTNS